MVFFNQRSLAIKSYLDSPTPDTQGYHETITCFYVWLIEQFIKQAEKKQSIDTLADELISHYEDRSFPFTYYSKERLMSKTARLQWLEPDLKPLI